MKISHYHVQYKSLIHNTSKTNHFLAFFKQKYQEKTNNTSSNLNSANVLSTTS